MISGQMEVTVGDETAQVLNVGDAMLAEDLSGLLWPLMERVLSRRDILKA